MQHTRCTASLFSLSRTHKSLPAAIDRHMMNKCSPARPRFQSRSGSWSHLTLPLAPVPRSLPRCAAGRQGKARNTLREQARAFLLFNAFLEWVEKHTRTVVCARWRSLCVSRPRSGSRTPHALHTQPLPTRAQPCEFIDTSALLYAYPHAIKFTCYNTQSLRPPQHSVQVFNGSGVGITALRRRLSGTGSAATPWWWAARP